MQNKYLKNQYFEDHRVKVGHLEYVFRWLNCLWRHQKRLPFHLRKLFKELNLLQRGIIVQGSMYKEKIRLLH